MTLLHHETGVELTAEPRFGGRVRRLVLVSAVALGAITVLAFYATDAPTWVVAMLAGGWALMPATLAASLKAPRVRYGLIVPATLVILGLVSLCWRWLPDSAAGTVGWILTTVGVTGGAVLGTWLWYRMAPVPEPLVPPFSPARISLIAIHAGMVTIGLALVLWSLL